VGQATWQAVTTSPTGLVAPIGGDARLGDPLDAERGLLHHAAGAHRDIWVARLDRPRLPPGKVEIVEPADLVRTVFEQKRVPMQRL